MSTKGKGCFDLIGFMKMGGDWQKRLHSYSFIFKIMMVTKISERKAIGQEIPVKLTNPFW